MTYALPAAQLADHRQIPLLGFGTWLIKPEDAQDAVETALADGYRHIDTATAYRNEQEVGDGLHVSGLDRDEVFLTTKLPPKLFDQARRTLEDSLQKLGTDHLDLWLVHAPGGDGYDDPVPHVWQAFIEAQAEGLVRSIGVSNYTLDQIDALTEATGVTPVINQIVWNPFCYDADVAQGHRERGIVLQGYSALRNSNLADPTLLEIAAGYTVGPRPATAADVILSWHVRHGFVVLPRSTNHDHIEQNAAGAFLSLTEAELARIDALTGTWKPEEAQ